MRHLQIRLPDSTYEALDKFKKKHGLKSLQDAGLRAVSDFLAGSAVEFDGKNEKSTEIALNKAAAVLNSDDPGRWILRANIELVHASLAIGAAEVDHVPYEAYVREVEGRQEIQAAAAPPVNSSDLRQVPDRKVLADLLSSFHTISNISTQGADTLGKLVESLSTEVVKHGDNPQDDDGPSPEIQRAIAELDAAKRGKKKSTA